MLKLKVLAIIFVLSLAGIVLIGSRHFLSFAASDPVNEIANYKNWTRITKEPIAIKIDEASLAGG